MATPNFWTQRDFELYAFDYKPTLESVLEAIESNGHDPAAASENMIQQWATWEAEDNARIFIEDFDEMIEPINCRLNFFKIVLKDGYYDGIQMFVESTMDYDFEDYNNEDTHYEFDMYLSVFKRKYQAEKNRVRRNMNKIAEYFGMVHLACIGIFSNGEAVYELADTLKGEICKAA